MIEKQPKEKCVNQKSYLILQIFFLLHLQHVLEHKIQQEETRILFCFRLACVAEIRVFA